MQTVLWQDVVARIMALRDANPITVEKISPSNRKYLGSNSKERLDAHDIANRLMRKENYLIALFNKDILDLTLQFPFLGARQLFSRTLLWNLDWCIMGLIFNEYGQVRQLVLKDSHRKQLSDGLKARFVFAGYMNVILAPVIILYLMVLYFFRYFNVLIPFSACLVHANESLGVQKRPCCYWITAVHASGGVEVSRVQRASPSLPSTTQYVISVCLTLSRPVSEG